MKIVRNHKLFEDFFDNVDSEDIVDKEGVDNEFGDEDEYKGVFRFMFVFEFDKKKTRREYIDRLPLASIVKRFVSVANVVSFIHDYSVKVTLSSIELMLSAIKSGSDTNSGFTEFDDDRMYDDHTLKDVLYGLYDRYIADKTMTENMNVSFMVSFNMNPVAVPFIKFVNDFKKFQHIVHLYGNIGVFLSDSTIRPIMNYTVIDVPETEPDSKRQWSFAYIDCKFISMKTISELGTLMFGTDNKWWNEETMNKQFNNGEINKFGTPYMDNVPKFLRKINKYLKLHQENYICELRGYCEDDNMIVVYLDSKDYNFLTVRKITEYFKNMFSSFSVPDVLSVKAVENSIKLYVICYELPEQRPGKTSEKLKRVITDAFPFGVYLCFVDDSEYNRNFIDTGHINPETDAYSIHNRQIYAAVENFNKTYKDDLNKKQ